MRVQSYAAMLRNLLLTIVVIATSAVLPSLAQDQPSSECIAAYNATFNSGDTSCSVAYQMAFAGIATDQQKMMVCNSGQQCNSMIENVINLCGSTVRKAV